MKKTLLLLFLINSLLGYSQAYRNKKPEINSENEIRTSLMVNTGGPHFAIEYERMVNPNLGVGVFAKINTMHVLPDDYFELEDYGIGLKTRFYLNEYETSSFFENLGFQNVAKRFYADFFLEYVKAERYETQRTSIAENIYIIEREKIKNNVLSINLGIGKKFLFSEKLSLQFNLGLSQYLPTQRDLEFGGYFHLSLGYLF